MKEITFFKRKGVNAVIFMIIGCALMAFGLKIDLIEMVAFNIGLFLLWFGISLLIPDELKKEIKDEHNT
jgi:hypothetical protein